MRPPTHPLRARHARRAAAAAAAAAQPSQQQPPPPSPPSSSSQADEAANGRAAGTICGTPEYIAPEVFQGRPYGETIDWWTLGCLVYEMLVGRPPFRSADMGLLVQQIIRCKVKVPASVSAGAAELIHGLLTASPTARLGAPPEGAAAIQRAAFFARIDWERLRRKEVLAPCVPSENKGSDTGEHGRGAADGQEVLELRSARHGEGVELLHREFTPFAAARPAASAASFSRRGRSPSRAPLRTGRRRSSSARPATRPPGGAPTPPPSSPTPA